MKQHYVGTKILVALAMTRAAYNEYRGWKLPSDEDGADDGYLVEYQDGGKPNHPDHAGYISWTPKAQFDAAYVAIPSIDGLAPHQIRAAGELAQLRDKTKKLRAFVFGPAIDTVPADEHHRLSKQLDAMDEYEAILSARVALFR